MKKKIILILPLHFEIYDAFLANLKKVDIEVELLFKTDQDFRYLSMFERLNNLIRKTIFRDKEFKNKLKEQFHNKLLKLALKKIKHKVDYTLVIRPDFFSKETILLLAGISDQIISYQWDGIDRFPDVKDLIPLFDRFFVFDIDDVAKYKMTYPNIIPITNFYFDFQELKPQTDENNIFFIGGYLENRMNDISKITDIFKKMNLEVDINILYYFEETILKYPDANFNFIKKSLNYLETLERIKKANVVLDFSNSIHNGLSFRTFEALHLSKKLITNNPIVKNYDFYNPNNILYWDENISENTILEFINVEYEAIDNAILKKYSFTNWIRNVLDIKPFEEIVK